MLKLIKANLRHNKFNMIAVVLLLIIATTLICVGASIAFKAPVLYDEKCEQLEENSWNMMFFTRKSVLLPLVLERFKQCPQIETMVVYSPLYYKFDRIEHNNLSGTGEQFFTNFEVSEKYRPKMIEYKQVIGNAIYVNSYMAKLGDVYKFILGDKTLEFEVAGVYESIMAPWGSNEIFVDTETYNLIAETLGTGESVKLLKGELIDNSIDTFYKAYDYFLRVSAPYIGLESMLIPNYSGIGYRIDALYRIKQVSENFLYILSSMLILFAFIIMAIALIITRFTITTGIDDNIRNLGILKAIGAETSTLRKTYMLQYLIAAAIAAVMGICAAFASKGFFVGILFMATAVNFVVPMNVGAIFIALAAIFLTVLLTVFLSTAKVRKIQPITALRKGLSTHSFKKNRVRLDKTRMNPNIALALKSIVNNKKHSVIIVAIVAITAFLSAFSSMLYFNMNIETQAMYSILGEDSNYFTVYNEDMKIDEILAIDGVDGYSTIGYNSNDVIKINGQEIPSYYSNDYSQFRISSVYEGRYPIADNEVAISTQLKNKFGVRIGDLIDVYSDNRKSNVKFMVTGFTQNMNNPIIAQFTTEGMCRLSGFQNDIVLMRNIGWKIYIKDGADATTISQILFDKYGENNVLLVREHIEQDLLGTLAPASAALMGVMIVVTILIIVMLLLLIIKIKLQRERRNFAVFKAQGYTTGDIIAQVTLSMLILSFAGAFVGAILGAVLCSPLMQLVLSGYGIMKAQLAIHWGFVIGIIVIINVVSAAASVLLSLKTKFISLRDLANDV